MVQIGFGAAKDIVLKVTSVPGTLTDISAYLTSVTGPSLDGQVAEVSTLGDTFKEFIRTQTDPGPISMEGIHDPTVGTMLFAMGTAAAAAFELYPQGSASGKQKLSGSALFTSYETGGGIDDALTWSAEMQTTGTPTMGTVA